MLWVLPALRLLADLPVSHDDDRVHAGRSEERVQRHCGFHAARYADTGSDRIVPATTYGIAPILDLGRYGTLIAALRSSRGDDEAKKLSPTGSVEGAAGAGLIHAEYDIPLANVALSKAWHGGKRVLAERLYPQIVWIPPGVSDPRRARAFHPASLPQVIGADVRITSVTIEPTRERLIERVPNAPEWLWRLRERYLPSRPSPLVYAGRYMLMLNHIESEFPPKFHVRKVD